MDEKLVEQVAKISEGYIKIRVNFIIAELKKRINIQIADVNPDSVSNDAVLLAKEIIPLIQQAERKKIIAYLENEITTQDKRTAGEPGIKAHLNAVETCVIKTIIAALKE